MMDDRYLVMYIFPNNSTGHVHARYKTDDRRVVGPGDSGKLQNDGALLFLKSESSPVEVTVYKAVEWLEQDEPSLADPLSIRVAVRVERLGRYFPGKRGHLGTGTLRYVLTGEHPA